MVSRSELQHWFRQEVLVLEPVLTRFIRRHWRNEDDVADIRQEVYEKVLAGASRTLPTTASAYVFTVARNTIISRARRDRVVAIDLVAEVESAVPDADWLTPERHLNGRQALMRAQEGLDRLPPRCREILWLRKVEGLGVREVADRLGIGIDAVQQQTMLGMRALIDFMLGGEGRIQRPSRSARNMEGQA